MRARQNDDPIAILHWTAKGFAGLAESIDDVVMHGLSADTGDDGRSPADELIHRALNNTQELVRAIFLLQATADPEGE